MKLYKKSSVAIVILVIATVMGLFFKVSAQSDNEISDEQISLIKLNCLSTKETLNRIHASDALLRVNMGQIYESISTKLMAGFDGRVVGNNLNGVELVDVSSDYESTLNKFRADYIKYEENLSSALAIDCSKQPVSFYDSVASARLKRKQVNVDVKELNRLINLYEEAVNNIEEDFKILNSEVE